MPITPLSEHLSPVPLRLSYLAPATVSSNRAKAKAKAFAIALAFAFALASAFLTRVVSLKVYYSYDWLQATVR